MNNVAQQKDKNVDELQALKEKYVNKSFHLVLQLLAVFGGPAAVALILGKYLDARFETGKTIVVLLLVLAFISSWIIVVRQYLKLSKDLKDVDAKLKVAKEKENKDNYTI